MTATTTRLATLLAAPLLVAAAGLAAPAAAHAAAASATGAATGATAAACKPSDVLDLSNWKETLPTGEQGKPDEVSQPELNGYDDDPWFLATSGCDAVRFRAPVNGVTTSGSKYPRSELREMTDGGSEKASWSTSDGTHTLVIDEAVTHLPNDRPHIVVGQIHDADDDVTMFRLEGGSMWLTKGDTPHYKLITDDYRLGTRFQAKFVASDGEISAYYDGDRVATFDSDTDTDYFKAGAYTQANCDRSDPCSDSNYGETEMHAVTVTHDD